MISCEICNRIKDKANRVVIYEDNNVLACLSKKQITIGKTSVYYKKHVTKFSDLSKAERDSLMDSVIKVARLLESALKPDQMNYLLLGNYHPHLHWHLIPRYKNKLKDNFYFKNGLEYPHMGREIQGRYDASKAELEKLAKLIKKQK